MTGPEHYQRAESLLSRADGQESGQAAYTVAKAQVHATLAQAAATGLTVAAMGELPIADCDSWTDVAGINSVQGDGS